MMRLKVRKKIDICAFFFLILQLSGTYSFYSKADQLENAPWPPSTKNKPNHYDQSLSTIYRPFHQDDSGPKGLSSHLKYSLPNKYYDVCSHKGCRNGSKAKGSASHMKQWPRQLLNHRIDYQRENKDEDPEYKAKMEKLLALFRKRMTSYIRPEEDNTMQYQTKRASDQKDGLNKSGSTLKEYLNSHLNAQNRVKSLYFDLLKRDAGLQPETKNDSDMRATEHGPKSQKLVKELYFDLLKRDSKNKTQSPNNVKQDDQILMAKELFFNLMKRNVNSKMSTNDLYRFSKSRNPEEIAKLKGYLVKFLVQQLKAGYNDPANTKKLLNRNGNSELVKDLYFDLLKRNVDPKPTGSAILKLLKSKQSKLNKNLGMVKDLYFKLLKRDSSSKDKTMTKTDPNLDGDLKSNKDIGQVKTLFFDLLKRSSDQKLDKSDLLNLIKMKLMKGQIPNLDKNLNLLKDLYFKLLKRDNRLEIPTHSGSQISNNEGASEVSDQFDRKAKELYLSLLKRNENTTKTDDSDESKLDPIKTEKLNKKLGLVKELFFNLLKRDNTKKGVFDTKPVNIPYSNYPHLEGKPDVVKHLFFNFFD